MPTVRIRLSRPDKPIPALCGYWFICLAGTGSNRRFGVDSWRWQAQRALPEAYRTNEAQPKTIRLSSALGHSLVRVLSYLFEVNVSIDNLLDLFLRNVYIPIQSGGFAAFKYVRSALSSAG